MAEKISEPVRAEYSDMNNFLEHKLEAFEGVCASLIKNPPRGDQYIATAARAIRWGVRLVGPLQDAVYGVWINEPDINASQLVTRILRAEQKAVYGQPGWDDYPQRFAPYPGPWYETMQWIADDPGRYSTFLQHVNERPKSSVLGRVKGLQIVGSLAMKLGRISELRYVDVGTGLMIGPNELASGLSHTPPNVVCPGADGYRLSLPLTSAVGALLNDSRHAVPFGTCLAMDKDDIADAAIRQSALLDSFYPGELLDTQRVEKVKAIASQKYPTVRFMKANFATVDLDHFYEENPAAPREIYHLSTMLNQISEPGQTAQQYRLPERAGQPHISHEDRRRMIDKAKTYATELVVVQDFAMIDPDNAEHLLFPEDWRAEHFPYHTLVMDVREPNPRWHDVLQWRDGRCTELAIGLSRPIAGDGGRRSTWSVLDEIVNAGH